MDETVEDGIGEGGVAVADGGGEGGDDETRIEVEHEEWKAPSGWTSTATPGAAIRYARGMIACYSGGIVVEVEDRWPTPAQRQELFDAIAWKFEKVPSGRIGAEPVELRTLAANAEGENVEDALVRWRHTRHGDKPMTRLRPDTRALPSYAPSGLCTDRGGR